MFFRALSRILQENGTVIIARYATAKARRNFYPFRYRALKSPANAASRPSAIAARSPAISC